MMMGFGDIKEDVMQKELKRSGWGKFFKKFSLDNQYRSASVTRSWDKDSQIELGPGYPFLGAALAKKGRLIDGIQFLAGCGDSERVAYPFASLEKPAKVILHSAENGDAARLEVHSEDKQVLAVVFRSAKERQQFYGLIEKVAYDIFERRGASAGSDWNDWMEAERKVREAELSLTK